MSGPRFPSESAVHSSAGSITGVPDRQPGAFGGVFVRVGSDRRTVGKSASAASTVPRRGAREAARDDEVARLGHPLRVRVDLPAELRRSQENPSRCAGTSPRAAHRGTGPQIGVFGLSACPQVVARGRTVVRDGDQAGCECLRVVRARAYGRARKAPVSFRLARMRSDHRGSPGAGTGRSLPKNERAVTLFDTSGANDMEGRRSLIATGLMRRAKLAREAVVGMVAQIN